MKRCLLVEDDLYEKLQKGNAKKTRKKMKERRKKEEQQPQGKPQSQKTVNYLSNFLRLHVQFQSPKV